MPECAGVGAVRYRCAIDAVIGRVVLDLIEQAAVPVVGVQHGFEPIGANRIALEVGGTDASSDALQFFRGIRTAVRLDALTQGDVRLVLVEPGAFGRLVRDLVRFHPTPSSVAPR